MTVRNIKLASWYFLALMLFAWATACFPPVEEDFNSIHYSLKDPQVRNIIELKDKGSLDSLASYLNEKKASYRYLAAMGFASLKDSASVRKLIPLLSDPVEGGASGGGVCNWTIRPGFCGSRSNQGIHSRRFRG